LFEIVEGDVVRYRCRVGHAWSAESLLAEQGEVLEAALWTALRALEEKSELSRRMATSARGRGRPLVATRLDLSAEDASGAATVIRRMLESLPGRESGGLPVAAGD
jgi:two-component system chemotaxis response regulator CheB